MVLSGDAHEQTTPRWTIVLSGNEARVVVCRLRLRLRVRQKITPTLTNS